MTLFNRFTGDAAAEAESQTERTGTESISSNEKDLKDSDFSNKVDVEALEADEDVNSEVIQHDEDVALEVSVILQSHLFSALTMFAILVGHLHSG